MPNWKVVMTCTVIDTLEACIEIEATSEQAATEAALDMIWDIEWTSLHDGGIDLENVDVGSVTLLPSTTVVTDKGDQQP